ncbi:PLC-like phosphodiesterase [Pilobolus umbonatus]|nr:PLC-like phosphodiesterase [Pilobolus umbonatus]
MITIGFYIILFCCALVLVLSECNGGATLCDRRYNELTQLVTHDSYALSPNIAATQDVSITDQLGEGVRGIKLTAVLSSSTPPTVHLCHTFCKILDAGPASQTLDDITAWLESNPREIVTIMWNNLYDISATQLASVYEDSNILPYVYTHNHSRPNWPTLNEMIDSGTRVVNFIDSQANENEIPWLMEQFSYVFETPYENVDINAFNCNIDRINPDKNSDELMYVMNHFVYGMIEIGTFKVEIPLKGKAKQTNTYESLSSHIIQCTNTLKKKPSFIEVDFYHMGDVLAMIADLNAVTAIPSRFIDVSNFNASNLISDNYLQSLSPTTRVLINNGKEESASPEALDDNTMLFYSILGFTFLLNCITIYY